MVNKRSAKENQTMKKIKLFAALIVASFTCSAQVGIGTTNPDDSAILDIVASGAQGLIIPRLSTNNRDTSIKSPTAGILIYNTTTNALEVVSSDSVWINLSTGATTAVVTGTTNSIGLVGIGTSSPDDNAALDITSATKGVLLPKSATDPTGVVGMIYYNTVDHEVRYYNGSWRVLTN